jgi:uncharacterized protein (TIGR03435 family)
MHRPILDKTALGGDYDFTLKYTTTGNPPAGGIAGSSVGNAQQFAFVVNGDCKLLKVVGSD